MVICRRCGKCCCVVTSSGKVIRCRFLMKFGKIHSCRIYRDPNRIGTIVYSEDVIINGVEERHIWKCNERKNIIQHPDDTRYKDCPL